MFLLQMKAEEKIAFEFLFKYTGSKPVYEPDGNVPPDFKINSEIKVEVRRLNQNVFYDDFSDTEGLANVEINLPKALNEVLTGFDKSFNGESFRIAIRFWRSIDIDYKSFKELLKSKLTHFLKEMPNLPYSFEINQIAKIRVLPGTPKQKQIFKLFFTADQDGGGWVIPILKDNISYCITEKSKKIKPFKKAGEKWWLILINHIAFWGEEDIEDIHAQNIRTKEFDKVLVVERLDNTLKMIIE